MRFEDAAPLLDAQPGTQRNQRVQTQLPKQRLEQSEKCIETKNTSNKRHSMV